MLDFIMNKVLARINFVSLKYLFTGREYNLTQAQLDKIEELLHKENLIILTWRYTHLTSYLTSLAHWLLMLRSGKPPKFGRWSHVAINIEYDSKDRSQFKIFEAIASGVKRNRFEDVFNADKACLLRVRGFDSQFVSDAIKAYLEAQLGKKYDTTFNLSSDKRLSCVELIYNALKHAGYPLTSLHDLICEYKNLTPDMYYECREFEIVYE
jgi:uncharacterized protein YycO